SGSPAGRACVPAPAPGRVITTGYFLAKGEGPAHVPGGQVATALHQVGRLADDVQLRASSETGTGAIASSPGYSARTSSFSAPIRSAGERAPEEPAGEEDGALDRPVRVSRAALPDEVVGAVHLVVPGAAVPAVVAGKVEDARALDVEGHVEVVGLLVEEVAGV